MTTTDEHRRQSLDVQTIARLTVELREAEGQRDALLREQLDADGRHDRHPRPTE